MSGKLRLKRILQLLLPPIVIVGTRRLRMKFSGQPEWEAVADNDAVWKQGDGWAHESISRAQERGWDSFVSDVRSAGPLGSAGAGPSDGQVDVGQHNNIVAFGYALAHAGYGREKLSVLDWGGGVGQYHVYAGSLLPELALEYVVKDVSPLCEVGRKLQPQVSFVSEDDAAFGQRYDFVFASSALQYSRDFYGTLSKMCDAAGSYLMITRSPFVEHAQDFVVLQRPHIYGYMTEYAAWFVNRTRFLAFVKSRGFTLEREFLVAERPFVPNAPEQCQYRGFLFKRDPAVAA